MTAAENPGEPNPALEPDELASSADDDSPVRPLDASDARGHRAIDALLLVRAVVVIALGAVVIFSGSNRPVLGNLLATYWLLGAALTLGWLRRHRGEAGSRLALVASVVGILAGVIGLTRLLVERVVSPDGALAIVGITSIAIGVLRISGAFRVDAGENTHPGPRVVLGLGEIVIGIVFIVATDVNRTITTAVGLWALIGGTIMMIDAIRARRARNA